MTEHVEIKNTINRLSTSDFGQLSSGETTQLFTLNNKMGTHVSITNFGGIITSINTRDNNEVSADIVLGYDNIQSYENDPYYLGAVIGRYAGRIDQGIFSIKGEEFQLTLNAPDSQLHGGKKALNKQLWHAA